MKAIDSATARVWCEHHGFKLDDTGLPRRFAAAELEDFAIPEDAGARVALVRDHMQAFDAEDEVCVWLDDWDVWQSGQRWHIFERFLVSYGISDSIMEKPAYVVQKKDFEVALSAATFAVPMLADCYILGSSGRTYLFYSHDEIGHKGA